jgi:type IV secretory pathway VirB4 component
MHPGLDDQLAVLSGRTKTVARLDRTRAEFDDDDADWLPAFRRACRMPCERSARGATDPRNA